MNIDTELDEWRRVWRSEIAIPPDLRRRVARQSRWLKIGLAGDILVTIAIGGGVLVAAARAPQPAMLLLAAATWTFIAGAWAFRLSVLRGLWSPAAITSAAFIELSIRRARAQIKATYFGIGLYVLELVFCLAWIYFNNGPRPPLVHWLVTSPVNRIVWVVSVAFFILIARYRRKKRAELEWLLALASGQ